MSTTTPLPAAGKVRARHPRGPRHRRRDRAHPGGANSLGVSQPIVSRRGVQLTQADKAAPDEYIAFLTDEPVGHEFRF